MLSKQLKMNQKSKKIYHYIKTFLLSTLGASFLENIWICKRVKAKIPGHELIRADEETIIAAQHFLLLIFNNFEIQVYDRRQPKFSDVYLRNDLLKIKDGAYIININEYKLIET